MLITLHCGGMPFDGTTIESKSLGGSESAAYYMAKELAAKGHSVTLFTNTDTETFADGVRYVPCGDVTEHHPLGEMFHYYAANTPCDIMIIQRHPLAFKYKWASKINLWWIHDLALQRNKGIVQEQMWNIDGVLCVSEWHKKQVCEVYGLNERNVFAITNGVDLTLFQGELRTNEFGFTNQDKTKLFFSSRPERGLEILVKPGGIMERLYEIDKNFHLYVCGYDNTTPQQRDYYNFLWGRCNDLPNVTNLGALTKQELADTMRQCNLHVYPSTFEETSCITAMEDMAAGLPMIASHVGALPETVEGAAVDLIDLKNGEVDLDTFVAKILSYDKKILSNSSELQLERAPFYSWFNAAQRLETVIDKCTSAATVSEASVVKELINKSDIYALKDYISDTPNGNIEKALSKELTECYAFIKEPVWDEHYAKYYQYEKDRGVDYGPEDITNNHRFIVVSGYISSLPEDSIVLDYGCAHGHYTISLAKQNPDKRFIGIDITESNVNKARAWAEEEGLSNVTFQQGRVENGRICKSDSTEASLGQADCIIAAEVLEHVSDPHTHANVLQNYLKEDGLMVVTTPYGPWEAQGYKEHWPWRAHVHHFEREDLFDLWGHNESFNVTGVPSGHAINGDVLGSYVITWTNTSKPSGSVDYKRKTNNVVPHQTLSCCMIVKDAASSIRRCLESVMPYADELVIGMDCTSTFETEDIISDYMRKNWPEKSYVYESIKSPTEIGFDAARNITIEKASGDWILWIDADEYLHNGQILSKYLRNNQYNGYAIPQHHFSMQPVGVQKVDLPVRLFRNHQDIKFLGVVHEHPEQKLNEGVGFVTTTSEISILHDGYTDEATRRKRFSRNVGLLLRDREKNPDRILGKFLWLRDLAQMSQWELEDNGGNITEIMVKRANEGIQLWHELLDSDHIRVVVDSLDYYSTLSRIRGQGFEMDLRLDTSKQGNARADEVRPVHAYFNSKDDAQRLLSMIFDERTKPYEAKYQ